MPNQYTVSKREFYGRVAKNPNEQLDRLIQLPKRSPIQPGDHIVAMVSGGIDSSVMVARLTETLRGHIYPLYVEEKGVRGAGHASRKSVAAICSWYRLHYPNLVEDLTVVPNWDFRSESVYGTKQALTPDNIRLKELVRHISSSGELTYPLVPNRLFMYPLLGAMHCRYLKARYGIEVNKIALGILPADGLTIVGQTLTHTRFFEQFVRHTMLTDDYQIITPFYDDTTYTWMDKEAVVSWAMKSQIPLDMTWSCTRGFRRVCGKCDSCLSRQMVFHKFGIQEPDILLEASSFFSRRGLGLGLMPKIRTQLLRGINWLLNLFDR
jgi:7-cyano-7-deazaguanine synthase in queuosine biosynthesis